jgi:hypothetical protein
MSKRQSVEEIIQWYEGISQDPAFNDVATLMQQRAKLAAILYSMSVTFAGLLKGYRRQEFLHEIALKRRIIMLTAETDNATGKAYSHAKAEAMAKVELSIEGEAVAASEGEIEGWKIYMRQANAVLEAMRQDIAELRKLRDDQ